MKYNIHLVQIGLVTCLLTSGKIVYGQYTIKGKVVDKQNHPLEFTTVVLQKDSIPIRSTFSDSIGNYILGPLHVGKYKLIFSYVTCETKKIPFILNGDTTINVDLISSINELNEVVVTDQKALIERKADRLIFNVENSISNIGSNVSEALNKTPGVRIDDNQIKLIGKSTVNVLIDDKLIKLSGEELINFLRSMPADEIARIEVITNPPAKYDAEGNSGLINIVRKKNRKKGYQTILRSGYTQATYPTVSGSGNLTYNKGKLSTSINLNSSDGSTQERVNTSINYPHQAWKNSGIIKKYRKNTSIQTSIDYRLTSKTLLSGVYQGNWSNGANPVTSHLSILNNGTQLIDSTMITNSNNNSSNTTHLITIYLEQKLDSTGKTFTLNGDSYLLNSPNTQYFNTLSYGSLGQELPNSKQGYSSTSSSQIRIFTLSPDFNLPYSWGALSCGGKLSFIQNQSKVDFHKLVNTLYQPDPDLSNAFTYDEHIQALYISVSKTWRKWDWKMGLRGEYTQTKGFSRTLNQTTPNNYKKLFPTFYATYQLTDNHIFSWSYGRRISRPYYSQLNPSRFYLSLYSYGEGNPFLQPSFTDNIEWGYTYKSLFNTSLYMSHIQNERSQVSWIEPGSTTQVFKFLNAFTEYSYGWYANLSLRPWHWLENTNYVDIYYTQIKPTLQGIEPLEGWRSYVSSNSQIICNKKKTIIAEINFWYLFPGIDNIYRLNSIYQLNTGIRFLFLENRLQLAIHGDDIFKTNKIRSFALTNNIQQEMNIYRDSRQIRLTIQYRFGNEKVKYKEKKSGNEEERKRSSGM